MSSRNYATDLLRIVAAFFVVMIHCADLGSTAGIAYNSLSRFSVPVFVMISGYHVLNRPVSLGKIGKKVGKTFCLFLLWSGVFYGYSLLVGRLSYTDFKGMVVYLITGPIHLWYLYAAMALYLLTPLLQVFHQNAAKATCIYSIVFLLLVGSLGKTLLNAGWIPLLNTVVGSMKLPTTVGFVGLYLLGGYLAKYDLAQGARRFLYCLAVLGTVATGAFTWLFQGTVESQLFLSFFSPTVVIAGIGLFVFFLEKCKDFKPKNPKVLTVLSKSSLGIYLFHPLLNMAMADSHWAPFLGLPPFVSIPLTTALVFLLSLAIVSGYYILKRTKESL